MSNKTHLIGPSGRSRQCRSSRLSSTIQCFRWVGGRLAGLSRRSSWTPTPQRHHLEHRVFRVQPLSQRQRPVYAYNAETRESCNTAAVSAVLEGASSVSCAQDVRDSSYFLTPIVTLLIPNVAYVRNDIFHEIFHSVFKVLEDLGNSRMCYYCFFLSLLESFQHSH